MTPLPLPAWATTPVSKLTVSRRSTDWCDRLDATANYNFGGGKKHMDTATADFGLKPLNYSQNIYECDGSDPKNWRHVAPRNHGFNGYFPPQFQKPDPKTGKLPMALLPHGATPGTGRDGQMSVLDTSTGEVWNYWALSVPEQIYGLFDPNWSASSNNPFGERPQLHGVGFPGFDPNTWCVVAGIEHFPAGDVSNLNVHAPAAGMHVGPVRPEEIGTGIFHVQMASVSGRCSMTGPIAPATIQDPDDPAIGTTYGISSSPAPLLESRALKGDLTGMVPDGTRFSICITDAEIEAWLDSRKFTNPLRTTAKAIAVALRDYGFYTGATSGPDGPAMFPFDGSAAAVSQWKKLGILPTTDLLGGLITRPRLISFRPPQAIRPDGSTSYREGPATSFVI